MKLTWMQFDQDTMANMLMGGTMFSWASKFKVWSSRKHRSGVSPFLHTGFHSHKVSALTHTTILLFLRSLMALPLPSTPSPVPAGCLAFHGGNCQKWLSWPFQHVSPRATHQAGSCVCRSKAVSSHFPPFLGNSWSELKFKRRCDSFPHH